MAAVLNHLSRERLTARDLDALYTRLHAHPDFAAELISALDQLDAHLTYRALALLLKLARASALSPQHLPRIADRLDASDHWLHRLIACQLLAAVPLPLAFADDIMPFLERSFDDRRVIVRAWALTAMLSFRRDPRFRSTVLAALHRARRDPAKSMQARLRQILPGNPARAALRQDSTFRPSPTEPLGE
jgi:hypothetical protein